MAIAAALIAMLFTYVRRLAPHFSRAAAIQRESHDRYRFLAEGPPSIGIVRFSVTEGR